MAVLNSTTWRVHPGKTVEFIEATKEAKKIHARLGGQGTLVQWNSAATLSGTMTYGLLVPDWVAWGQFIDAAPGDSEWGAWAAKNFGADAVATPVSQITSIDRPGFDQPDSLEPGTFLLAQTFRAAPGRTGADVVSFLTAQRDAAVRLGARWQRVFYTGVGGEQTRRSTALLGFENAVAYGEWQEKYAADSEGQSNNATMFGPDSPLGELSLFFGRVLDI